jgi:hypothetical protein
MRLDERLLDAADHLDEIGQHEVTPAIREAIDALRAYRHALETLRATCEQDEAQGYRSNLRTYVLEIVKPVLDAEVSA